MKPGRPLPPTPDGIPTGVPSGVREQRRPSVGTATHNAIHTPPASASLRRPSLDPSVLEQETAKYHATKGPQTIGNTRARIQGRPLPKPPGESNQPAADQPPEIPPPPPPHQVTNKLFKPNDNKRISPPSSDYLPMSPAPPPPHSSQYYQANKPRLFQQKEKRYSPPSNLTMAHRPLPATPGADNPGPPGRRERRPSLPAVLHDPTPEPTAPQSTNVNYPAGFNHGRRPSADDRGSYSAGPPIIPRQPVKPPLLNQPPFKGPQHQLPAHRHMYENHRTDADIPEDDAESDPESEYVAPCLALQQQTTTLTSQHSLRRASILPPGETLGESLGQGDAYKRPRCPFDDKNATNKQPPVCGQGVLSPADFERRFASRFINMATLTRPLAFTGKEKTYPSLQTFKNTPTTNRPVVASGQRL